MGSRLRALRSSVAAALVRKKAGSPDAAHDTPRAAIAIVTLTIIAIIALSLWYLVQPQPLLVQGEADAIRIDIAARVDGRVATIAAERGGNVAAGASLI